jgi:hypothetical protein
MHYNKLRLLLADDVVDCLFFEEALRNFLLAASPATVNNGLLFVCESKNGSCRARPSLFTLTEDIKDIL